jgi:hypothetical protein
LNHRLGIIFGLIIFIGLHLDPHLMGYLLITLSCYPHDGNLVGLIEQDPHLPHSLALLGQLPLKVLELPLLPQLAHQLLRLLGAEDPHHTLLPISPDVERLVPLTD